MPDWLDADTLRWVILGALVVVVVAMFLVVRFVQKLVMKLMLFVLLAGLGLALWIQREDLRDCVDTCSCSLFGQDVNIPADKNPNCA